MVLREAYIRVETEIIQEKTKELIRSLKINIGEGNPNYEKKYKAIMRDLQLRIEELTSLSK